jgi:hypothetical protein
VGLWWIIALPREIMLEFMGGSIARTITFLLGFLLALSAVLMALRGRLMATLFHLLGIVAVMVIQRALLRASYLREWMDMGAFELRPQTSVLILFLAVLLAGAGSVWWMVRKALEASGTSGRTQS